MIIHIKRAIMSYANDLINLDELNSYELFNNKKKPDICQ